jgi:hypothetical protein
MAEITYPRERTYYIAHNGDGVYHVGYTDPDQVTTTGQPSLETFTKEPDIVARCDTLSKTTVSKSADVDRLKRIAER